MENSNTSFTTGTCKRCGQPCDAGKTICKPCEKTGQKKSSWIRYAAVFAFLAAVFFVFFSIGGVGVFLLVKNRADWIGQITENYVPPPPQEVPGPPPKPPKSPKESNPNNGTTQKIPPVANDPILPEIPPSSAALPANLSAEPVANQPIPTNEEAVDPPVVIAYREMMDEIFKSRKGKIQVGSPSVSPKKVKIDFRDGKEKFHLVFVEKSNDGKNAVVVVGEAENAGGFRSYSLRKKSGMWVITACEEWDG